MLTAEQAREVMLDYHEDGTITILASIRECALKGQYYYQTTNVSDETIKELRELGYVVTQGLGDVHWAMIEW